MFDSDLTQGLDELAAEIEITDEERVRARFAHRIRGRRILTGITYVFVGVAAATAGVVTLHALGVMDSPGAAAGSVAQGPAHVGVPNITLPIEPGEPCPYADEYSLGELAALSPTPVWMPDSTAASTKNLSGAWMCMHGGAATLSFDSGVVINFESGWQGVDPEKKWSGYIDFYGIGEIENISGIPSLVEAPSKDAPRGEVAVVYGDTLIRVLGDGHVTGGDLVDVAKSIDLRHPIDPK